MVTFLFICLSLFLGFKDGEIDVSDIIKIRDRILGVVGEDYQKKS